MWLKRFSFVCCLGYSVLAFAQSQSMDAQCQKMVLEAEKQRNPQIYAQCGFDDAEWAVKRWRDWAERNSAYQAMYELCVRYPGPDDAGDLCQKAALAGNGSALLYQADELYDQKKYAEAFQNYTKALKSPTLTPDEKGQIAERIGVLYMDPQSSYYNPAKGLPLIEKATKQRGALANNILGVYSIFGLEKQPADMKKAYEYLWRSVLLGCPNAEENLGLFYMLYQKKITSDDARRLMSDKIFTCKTREMIAKAKTGYKGFNKNDCDCAKVMQKESMLGDYPYRLISAGEAGVVLQDKNGQRFTATKGETLANGARVIEIHKTAAILLEGKKRQILNVAPDENCVQYCKIKQRAPLQSKTLQPEIEPYHITFTPSECSDLLYYAERLVDTRLPFTGKKECGFSGELDEATQLLMAQ